MTEQKIYSCPFCKDVTFANHEDLSRHLKAAISRVPAFNAPAINKTDHLFYYRHVHGEC